MRRHAGNVRTLLWISSSSSSSKGLNFYFYYAQQFFCRHRFLPVLGEALIKRSPAIILRSVFMSRKVLWLQNILFQNWPTRNHLFLSAVIKVFVCEKNYFCLTFKTIFIVNVLVWLERKQRKLFALTIKSLPLGNLSDVQMKN